MSSRGAVTLAGAASVMLAVTGLRPVYADLGWVVRVGAAVAAVGVSCWLARALAAPRWAQPLAGVLGLVTYVVLAFAAATLRYAVLPTGETVRLLHALLVADAVLAHASSARRPLALGC